MNRSALLPEYQTPPSSGRSSPFGNAASGHRYADDLEGQNDENLEGLTAKVKLLKDVSESCACVGAEFADLCAMGLVT